MTEREKESGAVSWAAGCRCAPRRIAMLLGAVTVLAGFVSDLGSAFGQETEISLGVTEPANTRVWWRETVVLKDDPAEQVYTPPGLPAIADDQALFGDEVVQAPAAPQRPGAGAPAVPPPVPLTPAPAAPRVIPQSNFLASSLGAARAAQTVAPFMLGDAFGSNNVPIIANSGGVTLVYHGSLNVAGRLKLAEDFSPMPRDRVFFDYNYFNDVPLVGSNNDSVNRYVPAFEKTFFNGWSSIEMRIPSADTLNSTVNLGGANNLHQGQFGDLFLSFKTLLWRSDTQAFAGGMALTIPTANSIVLQGLSGPTIPNAQIGNRAVYFQPYLAYLWTPNERLYAQALLTVDVASGGSPVNLQVASNGPLLFAGNLNNQTLLNVNISTGYWAYLNPRGRYVTGIAPIFELHQWQTLSASNVVVGNFGGGPSIMLGGNNLNFQLLNFTTGVNVQLGPMSSLLAGFSAPIGSGPDKQFGGEFHVAFNRRFGPQNRLTRAQF